MPVAVGNHGGGVLVGRAPGLVSLLWVSHSTGTCRLRQEELPSHTVFFLAGAFIMILQVAKPDLVE